MPQKFRNWCFTLNNPNIEDIESWNFKDVEYMIIGWEVGEQGTEHLQGYMEFKNQKRLTEAKIHPKLHLEQRRGTQKQAIDYCMKDGQYYEFGEKKEQGRRSDLNEIKELLDNGGTMNDVAEEYFPQYIRYKFDKYTTLKKKLVHDKCTVYYTTLRKWDPFCYQPYFESIHYCQYADDINMYDGEECVVFTGSYHDMVIQLFARNLCYKLKYGYEIRQIRPKAVIINILDEELLEKFPRSLKATESLTDASEVSRGNTGPSSDDDLFICETDDSFLS